MRRSLTDTRDMEYGCRKRNRSPEHQESNDETTSHLGHKKNNNVVKTFDALDELSWKNLHVTGRHGRFRLIEETHGPASGVLA